MKKIAIANMKGGVGKTTTSIILADALSAIGGKRVLALDLDSQANLSWALLSPDRLDHHISASTMTRWLEDVLGGQKSDLSSKLEKVGLKPERNILPSWWRKSIEPSLHLAVSNTKMRIAELSFEGPIEHDQNTKLKEHLENALNALAPNYDYLIMDCSPALSALTRAGLRLADSIIVPTPLNNLCLSSLNTFQNIALKELLEIPDTPLFVVATRVGAASGKQEAMTIRNYLREGAKKGRWTFCKTEFRESVEYTRALTPPITGPHQTLRSRYGSKRSELKEFLQSLEDIGVLSNDA